VFCASAPDAVAAADTGAGFLVLRETLSPNELAALCRLVSVPVFARGIGLEQAWTLGASGISELP